MTQFQQILLLISGTSFVLYLFLELKMRADRKRREKEERDAKILYLLGKEYEPPKVTPQLRSKRTY